MTKWQLTRPDGPWEYPTLGFRASNGDILDATSAPDGFWSLASNQGAAETVKRIPGVAGDSGYVAPNDGYLLAWSAAQRQYVPVFPAGLVNPADVGHDVWLLVGQSNMVSYGSDAVDTTYLDAPEPRIRQFAGSGPYVGQVVAALDPLYHHEQKAGSAGHAITFAKHYLRTVPVNRSVLLVPCAHGSTGFTTSSLQSPPTGYTTAVGGGWDPSGAQGGVNLYEFAIAQANAAMASGVNNRLAGILWLQGEADAAVMTATAYAAKLDALIDGFRSRITGATADTVVLVGQMLPDRIATDANFQAISAVHVATPSRARLALASTTAPAGSRTATTCTTATPDSESSARTSRPRGTPPEPTCWGRRRSSPRASPSSRRALA